MTETQATSGAAGTSTTTPGEHGTAEGAETGTGSATGHAVVGRASVPADAPAPKFTRAAGMPAPPDAPPPSGSESADGNGAAMVAGEPERQTSAPPDTGRASVPSGARGAGPTSPPPAPATSATDDDQNARPGRMRTLPGGAKVAEAVRVARGTVSAAASRGPRRARLFVKRVDPWSVMKFSFAVAFVLFFVVIVATAVLYLALDAMGVWDSVNKTLGGIFTNNGGKSSFKITALGVIGTAGVLGLVNVVLFTALATLGAFIYNVCADLVGGIEVTLSEKD